MVPLLVLVTTVVWANPVSLAQEREQVRPVFERALPNVPGKKVVAVVVSYPPGAKSVAHRHAASAFIYAHVLSGAIRSQVNDGPVTTYTAGQSFSENPGDRHAVSENASTTRPARLLAVFVLDTRETNLTTPTGK